MTVSIELEQPNSTVAVPLFFPKIHFENHCHSYNPAGKETENGDGI